MKNIGDKIFYYEIKIDFKRDTVNTKTIESNVIGINDNLFVIDNSSFTTINQKLEKGYSSRDNLNKPHTHEFKYSTYYDELTSHMYSDKKNIKKAYETLKKDLETFIYEKHGRYCKGIDILKKLEIPTDKGEKE